MPKMPSLTGIKSLARVVLERVGLVKSDEERALEEMDTYLRLSGTRDKGGAIVYCDYLTGNDTTGDGTKGNPYKTITKASTGLGGSDFVRCGKSPADTALSGVMTWTYNSTTVSTSVDLTGVLAAKDFIRKTTLASGDVDVYWEIASITSTTITLQGVFYGATQSGVTSVKLGVTDTGTAAASTTVIQEVSASGASWASMLEVSGGWDLSLETPIINGKTVFFQSGANRYGYGIQTYSKNYVKLIGISAARYYIGHYHYSGRGIYLDNLYNLRSNSYNFSMASDYGVKVTNCRVNGGAMNFSNTSWGIYVEGLRYVQPSPSHLSADHLEMRDCKILGTAVTQSYAMGCNVLVVDCDFSALIWNYYRTSCNQKIYNTSINGVLQADIYPREVAGNNSISLAFKRYNGVKNDDRFYTMQGYIKRNIAAAMSGVCIEYIPYDADFYLRYGLNLFAAEGGAKTVKFSIKKSADFNGDCDAALYFNGNAVAAWTAMSLTESYVEKTLGCLGASIIEDGIVELQVRVRGTVGSVFVDAMTDTATTINLIHWDGEPQPEYDSPAASGGSVSVFLL